MANRRYREVTDHAEQLGAELIDQNAWYTSAYWNTFNANWSQVGITLSSNGNNGNLAKNGILIIGARYKVVITVTLNAGTFWAPYNGTVALVIAALGTYTYYFTPTFSVDMFLVSNLFNGTITALSVKQVLVNSTKTILDVCACDGTIRNRLSGNVYGNNLLTNGTFDTWVGNTPTGWTIIGEDASNYFSNNNSACLITSNGLVNLRLYQSVVVSGKTYRCSLTVSGTPGNLVITMTGGVAGTGTKDINSAGFYVFDLTSTGTAFLIMGQSASGCSIDNVSVKEIIPLVVNTAMTVVKI